jgi:hypothetical protein
MVGRERFGGLYLMVVSSIVELNAEYHWCLLHRLGRHHQFRTWSFFAGEAYLGL